MTNTTAVSRSARFAALVRLLVVLTALVTAVLVLSATHHVDTASSDNPGYVAAQVSAVVESPNAPALDAATTVVSAAVGVTALSCALLGLCCLFALARLSWHARRASSTSRVPRELPLTWSVPDSRPTIPSLQHLSISRT